MIGVSDSHNLTATATKTNLAKIKPKINYYWNYKSFDADMFDKVLSHGLKKMYNFNYGDHRKIFIHNLNKYSPIKKKTMRENNNNIMLKNWR